MPTAAQQLSFSRLFLALNPEVMQLCISFIVCEYVFVSVCVCECEAVYESERSFSAVGSA